MKGFVAGMFFALLLVGCAGFKWPYKYYGLDAADYQGKILGPTPKEDQSFENCRPTAANRSPCVILYADAFFALKQDYIDTKNQLQNCEASH